MLKVLKVDNYHAENHNKKFRRGFIIPIPRHKGSVLNVTDTDALDHEKLADEFVALKDSQINDILLEMGINDRESYDEMFNFIRGFKNKYNAKKDVYPSSRKDYLIYEEDTIAYDVKSNFGQGSFVIYREEDRSRRFYIEPETERIVFEYANLGWRLQPAPKDPHIANEPSFF